MRQIIYLIRKEFKQIFRTREMVAIIFGMPLVQMIILGFTITNEVKNVHLIISDNDNSHISREIIRSFEHTDRFTVTRHETDIYAITSDIQEWKAQMALVIPLHFGRDLERRRIPEIQVLIDGLDGNTAGVALGYARSILQQEAVQLNVPEPVLKGSFVVVQERMWYNLNLDNAQFMIPGIVVVLMTIISMMLSAMSLVREKEIGTLEQLMVSPLKRYQLLFGKIIPFLLLTFIELGLVMTLAKIIFDIEVSGSILLLGLLCFLYLFTTLGLGVFVSAITGSQQEAMFVSWFFMVFMLLMSGFFIPIENMPPLLQNITYLNPMRYILSIIRDIVQKGASLRFLFRDVFPMTVYGITIFLLAIFNFHKRAA
jgi:ABC-2 type transport system permease protein